MKTFVTLLVLLFLSPPLFAGKAPVLSVPAVSDQEEEPADDEIYVVNRSSSLKKLKESLEKSRKSKDRKKEGLLENEIGDYYWYAGNYPLSAEHYYSALSIFEHLEDSFRIALCYRNIGWIYMGQKNYNETLIYFTKSFELLKRLGKKKELIPAYDDLGIVYRETGNYAKSIECIDESIKLAEVYNKDAVATSIISLATSYRGMGRYSAAITQYRKAITLHEKIRDPYNLSYAYIDLGRCYIEQKNGERAVYYISKARDIAQENNYRKVEIDAIRYLGPAYQLQQNYAQAYRYSNIYAELADSITDVRQEREVQEMLAKYESGKKASYIRNLRKQEQLTNQRLAHEKLFKTWLAVFLGIVLVLGFFFLRNFRQRQKANQQLSLTYAELASRNKDIEDSINYARQIQQARLPDPQSIYGTFPQSFVLFKPKDVVSGDFYWFAGLKDNKAAFAAADCTGHGIPGAFMSLIGMDTIYQAVIDKELTDPSTALAAVNVSLKKTLRQNDQNSASRDGMDLALCIFDFERMQLAYAGAHRPLFLIRKGELTEIKATKHSIGGLTNDLQQFEGHRLDLQKNDLIYLFSDGYADQFGGKNNKKFSTRKFRELLAGIQTKPMAEQHLILDSTFEEWKGVHEQIDDVLVIGIRI